VNFPAHRARHATWPRCTKKFAFHRGEQWQCLLIAKNKDIARQTDIFLLKAPGTRGVAMDRAAAGQANR
jgi:hypothetical protein